MRAVNSSDLDSLMRDIDCKLGGHTATTQIRAILERVQRLRSRSMKGTGNRYALQASEGECIGEGKARQPYEFGVKVRIAIMGKRRTDCLCL